jgi:hypothetical protein
VRDERVGRDGRSKTERIIIKGSAAPVRGRGRTKSIVKEGVGVGGTGGYCCFAKVYSCSSRARGLLNEYLFFY